MVWKTFNQIISEFAEVNLEFQFLSVRFKFTSLLTFKIHMPLPQKYCCGPIFLQDCRHTRNCEKYPLPGSFKFHYYVLKFLLKMAHGGFNRMRKKKQFGYITFTAKPDSLQLVRGQVRRNVMPHLLHWYMVCLSSPIA